MGYENETNESGERYVWLAPNVVDRLTALRGLGESYSDVILRVAKARTRSMVAAGLSKAVRRACVGLGGLLPRQDEPGGPRGRRLCPPPGCLSNGCLAH